MISENMNNPREIAYNALVNVIKDSAYSNIALDSILSSQVRPKHYIHSDNAYITMLFYGVLERITTLDHIINRYNGRKLDIEVRIILRIGIFELLYMNSVPDNAAVSLAVSLCIYAKKTSAKGLVNAILRNFIRDNKDIMLPCTNSDEYYSVLYSIPVWLFRLLSTQYSKEIAIEIAKNNLLPPPLTIRVNTLKTSSEELTAKLTQKGIIVNTCDIKDCLNISKSGSIAELQEFKDGLFAPQDLASQLVASVVSPNAFETVIDCCAAPGSKSFVMAQLMDNKGKILAFDLFPHKIKLINEGAKRLGIDIIKASVKDMTEFDSSIQLADKVICDAPCSGLGVIRRKPEIALKPLSDELPPLQLAILNNCSKYVRDGGIIVYSTCTINKKENEKVFSEFLKQNNCFKPLQLSKICDKIKDENYYKTFLPHIDGSDGFFVAVAIKEKN